MNLGFIRQLFIHLYVCGFFWALAVTDTLATVPNFSLFFFPFWYSHKKLNARGIAPRAYTSRVWVHECVCTLFVSFLFFFVSSHVLFLFGLLWAVGVQLVWLFPFIDPASNVYWIKSDKLANCELSVECASIVNTPIPQRLYGSYNFSVFFKCIFSIILRIWLT